MFKNFSKNCPIHVLNLTARTHWIKGNIEQKSDLKNALSCFTEGIEVNCKDDALNARLYVSRSEIHDSLGELTRHIRFPF